MTPLEERFWAKVERGAPDECWIWKGARNNYGYGVVRLARDRLTTAHRLSLVFAGRDPGPLNALHSCDNASCVNPGHLSAGSQRRNLQEAVARGRTPVSKLTPEDVVEIRGRIEKRESNASIARVYGVSKSAIRLIAIGETWRELEAA